jgi:hypothetical protein
VGFEPTISAGKRPETYALDRAATGTGNSVVHVQEFQLVMKLVVHFILGFKIPT